MAKWMWLKTQYLTYFHDEKFHHNRGLYITQCLIATACIFLVLLSLNVLANDIVIATIGATSFIVFTMPHKEGAKSRYIVGSYILGVTVGAIAYYISTIPWLSHFLFLQQYYDEIFGAIAVGVTMFLMVILNIEHPPAAGLALALVLNDWDFNTLLVIGLAIILILSFRHLFRRKMIDLI